MNTPIEGGGVGGHLKLTSCEENKSPSSPDSLDCLAALPLYDALLLHHEVKKRTVCSSLHCCCAVLCVCATAVARGKRVRKKHTRYRVGREATR